MSDRSTHSRQVALMWLGLYLYGLGLFGCAHEGSGSLNDRVVVAAPAEVVEPYEPPMLRDLTPVHEAKSRLDAAILDHKIAQAGAGNLYAARSCHQRRLCEYVAAVLRAYPLGVDPPECTEHVCFTD